MCGLAGLWDVRHEIPDLDRTVQRMTDRLAHRGPDDQGFWKDEESGLALGHRRLAILDLSVAGRQPMVSSSGRYVLVFNGEVYNFQALREELTATGATFRGRSDTEVMLASIERWGLDEAVRRFIGMFAFALWDREERILALVRDRIGIKPLYLAQQGDLVLFSSELKAFRSCERFERRIDRDALTLFLRYNRVPAPFTIYERAEKVMPGTIARFRRQANGWSRSDHTYWDAREVVEGADRSADFGSTEEFLHQLEEGLRISVSNRMVSDVPLGAFLSGGIDSSLVVALMQQSSSRQVRTFCIGFEDERFDESRHSREVAKHLGTDHTELHVDSDQLLEIVPELPSIFDEPFADSSQIPTYLVSRLARESVTVSLSGDGGDELLSGYHRYAWGEKLSRMADSVPSGLRPLAASAVESLSPQTWDRLLRPLRRLLPSRYQNRATGDILHKLSGVWRAGAPEEMYRQLVSHWREPARIVIGGSEPPCAYDDSRRWPSVDSFTEHMMFVDLIAYLPDDILVKVDRSSMHVGLEARVPLLDHRVVELAWSMPHHLKVRDGVRKWALKRILTRHVPAELFERPKKGFSVPIAQWLRGSLRDWAEELLDPASLQEQGILHPDPIHRRWNEHLSGAREWHHSLWNVLMFQAWYESERRS